MLQNDSRLLIHSNTNLRMNISIKDKPERRTNNNYQIGLKKLMLGCFMLASSLYSQSQTKLFINPNSGKYVQETKTLAVIAFSTDIRLRPKELKDFTSEQIIEMENDEALSTQKAMHSWFLTREKRGELLVGVQSPTKTNALLRDAGIDPNLAHEQLASKLCEILGVEVIVTGTFETNKPMSAGAALGLAVLGFGGATNSATVNLDFIHKDDEIVVNYYKNIKGGLGSSSSDLVNVLMRKVSRRIPYTQ